MLVSEFKHHFHILSFVILQLGEPGEPPMNAFSMVWCNVRVQLGYHKVQITAFGEIETALASSNGDIGQAKSVASDMCD